VQIVVLVHVLQLAGHAVQAAVSLKNPSLQSVQALAKVAVAAVVEALAGHVLQFVKQGRIFESAVPAVSLERANPAFTTMQSEPYYVAAPPANRHPVNAVADTVP
jgi:hypothetical protein